MSDRPQVVAHRGASDSRAEHTLAAYRQALDEGADALECDVRLTADGHLVCVHDRRVERTSDGRGPVSTLELSELDALDFRSWKHPVPGADGPEQTAEAPDLDSDGRGVLTLRTLLAAIAAHDRPVWLAVETKHPTRYAGLVERRVVEQLQASDVAARVMSFSWLSLRRVREQAPWLPTVFLMDRVPLRFRDGSLPVGCSIAGYSVETVRSRPDQVRRTLARGHQVYVYTVNEPDDVDRCLELGVDAIITDRPGRTRHRVDTVHGT
jgi:glycerophosphoryl diester phosphodiesterase